MATLAAAQAGCTAAQVRQLPTAECSQESVEAMKLLEVSFSRSIEVDFDVNQPCAEGKDPAEECCGPGNHACLPLGPITSRVKVGSGKLVRGTLLSGQVWRHPLVKDGNLVVVRWTEATLPNGGKHPVCIEAGDGASRLCPNGDYVACRQQYATIVKRWVLPITP